MKCDMCENEATVFLTQIIDGKMNQVNLCDKCSKENGVTDPTGFQLADFLVGTAAQKKTKGSSIEDDSLACPNCGFTRAHLKKIGRMGCPECYATFASDLENMLRAMHKGTRHVGKVPTRQQLIQHTPDPNATTQAEDQETNDEDDITASQDQDVAPSPPLLPPPPPAVVSVAQRIQELKQAIEKAIVDERYEDAAKLRDEVRELESQPAE